MKITKIIPKIIFVLSAIIFILFPYPNADLYLRIHFLNPDVASNDKIPSGTCALYYTSDIPNAFSQEHVIQSEIDTELNCVTFILDSSLANKLNGLRIDFPSSGNLLCINNVTLSSAGIIQKQFNPCHFFAKENLIQKNDIPAMSLATARNHVYVQTGILDPYVILSDSLVSQINKGYSSYRLTRLGICIFIFAVYFMAKKNIFSKNQ